MKPKSLPLADTMSVIKGSGIKYMSQYQRFVDDNNLSALGIPKYPKLAYKSEFPGVDAFLGNPEGTAVKAIRELQSIQANKVKPWTKVVKHGRTKGSKNLPKIEVSVVAPVAEPVKPSFASIIDTLYTEYNIPLDVLYRLNETAKQTSTMKLETINDTLTVLVKIAMSKTKVKV
jgi:hypothetical protein